METSILLTPLLKSKNAALWYSWIGEVVCMLKQSHARNCIFTLIIWTTEIISQYSIKFINICLRRNTYYRGFLMHYLHFRSTNVVFFFLSIILINKYFVHLIAPFIWRAQSISRLLQVGKLRQKTAGLHSQGYSVCSWWS